MGLYRDYNRVLLGLYRENGKDNENYYIGGFRDLSNVLFGG